MFWETAVHAGRVNTVRTERAQILRVKARTTDTRLVFNGVLTKHHAGKLFLFYKHDIKSYDTGQNVLSAKHPCGRSRDLSAVDSQTGLGCLLV